MLGAGIYTALVALFLAILEQQRRAHKQGMTLIEILITVSIIAFLATFLLPAVVNSMQYRENAQIASHIRIAINAFDLYLSEEGSYPLDVDRGVIPAGMADYFDDLGIDWWTDFNELGAKWDWQSNPSHPFSSISFVAPDSSVSEKQLLKLDAMLETGNETRGDLTAGNFREVEGQYHYILEE